MSTGSKNTAKAKIALKKPWNFNYLHWMEDHNGMTTIKQDDKSQKQYNPQLFY